jgi:hypothetical protein
MENLRSLYKYIFAGNKSSVAGIRIRIIILITWVMFIGAWWWPNYMVETCTTSHVYIKQVRHIPTCCLDWRYPHFVCCVDGCNISISKCRIFMIIYWNCAGNKHRSYKITKMQMFATSEKEKPDTENIRGLNLAAAKRTTVQVTRKPL